MDSKNIVVIIATQDLFDIVSKDIENAGYKAFHYNGPSSLSKINSKQIHAILDISNNLNEELVKDFLDFAVYVDTKYIYGYKLRDRRVPEVVFIKKLINDYKKFKKLKAVILEIGDLYSPEIVESKKLDEYISSMLKNQSLKVANDEEVHYLLHLDDFIDAIVGIINKDYLGTYSIKNVDDITEVELAHFLNEISDIDYKIEYLNKDLNKKVKDIDLVLNTIPKWEQTVSLEEGLLGIFEHYDIPTYVSVKDELSDEQVKLAQDILGRKANLVKEKPFLEKEDLDVYEEYERSREEYLSKNKKVKKTLKDNNFEVKITSPKLFAFAFIFVLVLFSLPSIFYVYNFINAKINIDKAFTSFNDHNFNLANEYSNKSVEYADRLLVLPTPAKIGFLAVGLKAPVLNEIVGVIRNSGLLIEETSLGLSNNTKVSNVLGVSNVSNSREDIVLYQIDVLTSKNGFFENDLESYKKIIKDNQSIFSGAVELNYIVNALSSDKKEDKFLLVLQDEGVLRPSGGKMVELGVLSFNNNELSIEKVFNLNDINNTLLSSGFSIQPTQVINAIPKEESLKFENLLLDPRFAFNAKKVMQVVGSKLKEPFDGVISVNKSWLEKYIEQSSLDGIEKGSITKDTLMVDILIGLEDGSIQLFFNDETLESKVLENSWASFIKPFDGDFVYVVDSNIGTVGSDLMVEKNIGYEGYDPINESMYKRKLFLEYINKGEFGYTDNIRVFVPKNAVLKSATLVDNGQSKNIIKDVLVKPLFNGTVFDTDLYVEVSHFVVLELEYESQRSILNEGNLDLFVQKQPGAKYSNFKFYLDGKEIENYKLDEDLNITTPLFRLAK